MALSDKSPYFRSIQQNLPVELTALLEQETFTNRGGETEFKEEYLESCLLTVGVEKVGDDGDLPSSLIFTVWMPVSVEVGL